MNQSGINPSPKEAICAELATTAEQELNAFFKAVMNLFGQEQAELSADDWLNEFTTTKVLPASLHEWRKITLKACARLAARVGAPYNNYVCQALASTFS